MFYVTVFVFMDDDDLVVIWMFKLKQTELLQI